MYPDPALTDEDQQPEGHIVYGTRGGAAAGNPDPLVIDGVAQRADGVLVMVINRYCADGSTINIGDLYLTVGERRLLMANDLADPALLEEDGYDAG